MQSLEKTASMTQQMLNEILKPIDLRVQQFERGWRIETCNDNQGMMFYNRDRFGQFAETLLAGIDGLNKILEIVMNARMWVFNYYSRLHGCKNFDNPYFGCCSLEEMLIKKDLLDDK